MTNPIGEALVEQIKKQFDRSIDIGFGTVLPKIVDLTIESDADNSHGIIFKAEFSYVEGYAVVYVPYKELADIVVKELTDALVRRIRGNSTICESTKVCWVAEGETIK